MSDEKKARHANVARDDKRRLSLVLTLRRMRMGSIPRESIKPNSEPWMSEQPRSVAEAIALSDRIERSIHEWGISR